MPRTSTKQPLGQSSAKLSATLSLLLILQAGLLLTACQLGKDHGEHTVALIEGSSATKAQLDIQAALDISDPGASVFVTGALIGLDTSIKLNIPTEVRLVWQATCDFTSSPAHLQLSGSGLFELSETGSIHSKGIAIQVPPTANGLGLAINGGNIQGHGAYTIWVLGKSCQVSLNGGTVSSERDLSYVINCENSDFSMSGGLVIAKANNCVAVHVGKGRVQLTGGQIESVGTNTIALFVENGSFLISDGTVVADGPDSVAVTVKSSPTVIRGGALTTLQTGSTALFNSQSAVLLTGGTVTVQASQSVALGIDNGGSIAVRGGRIEAKAAQSRGIKITDTGIVAYLAGTILGELGVVDAQYTAILEIDSLTINASRHGTAEGIQVKQSRFVSGEASFTWDTSGASPKLSVRYPISNGSGSYQLLLEWGEP